MHGKRKADPLLVRAVLEISSWWHKCEGAGRLTGSDSTQAHIQGFQLAHPNIFLIYELLEHKKGPVLQIRSCRVSKGLQDIGL